MIGLNGQERGTNPHRDVGNGDAGNEIPTRGTGSRDLIPIVVLVMGICTGRGGWGTIFPRGGRGSNPRILFWSYVCEFHPVFPQGDKMYDRDECLCLTALFFGLGRV